MDFRLNSDQQALQSAARDFLRKEVTSTVVRSAFESPDGDAPELYKKMAELGWLGITVPEDPQGGLGMTVGRAGRRLRAARLRERAEPVLLGRVRRDPDARRARCGRPARADARGFATCDRRDGSGPRAGRADRRRVHRPRRPRRLVRPQRGRRHAAAVSRRHAALRDGARERLGPRSRTRRAADRAGPGGGDARRCAPRWSAGCSGRSTRRCST